jgi:hypothetical protein
MAITQVCFDWVIKFLKNIWSDSDGAFRLVVKPEKVPILSKQKFYNSGTVKMKIIKIEREITFD